MTMKVLACDGIHEDGLSLFRDAGWEVAVASSPIKDPDVLAAALADVDALLVRSATQVPGEALANAGRLRVIGRAGAGVDTIDVDAATARGIAVMNAADGNTRAAAEHALSLLFALARHVPRADAGMKAGQWPKAGLTGFELEGKRLGVIGLGRIGGTVARKARGIGMEVAAHDPFLPASAAAHGSVPLMALPELLAWADVVTLHIPRTKDTTHLLDARTLALMKPGAYLVNAARGGLVDEAALLEALDSGHLAGAALDTFATEPLPEDSPLRGHPKLVLTPHLGASTGEAQQAVSTILAREVLDYFETGAVAGCVNLPPLSAEAAREVAPWMPLMSALGRLAARLVPAPVRLHLRRTRRLPRPAPAHPPAGGRAARRRVQPRDPGERAAGGRRARAAGSRDRGRRRRRLRPPAAPAHRGRVRRRARDRGHAAPRPARGAAGRGRDRVRSARAPAADAERGPPRAGRAGAITVDRQVPEQQLVALRGITGVLSLEAL